MSISASQLLDMMKVRLECQEDGVTNPSTSVKAATKKLVEKLSAMQDDEIIEISTERHSKIRYISSSSGEVLAEMEISDVS